MISGCNPHRAVYNKCVQNSDIEKTIRMNQNRAASAHLAQRPSPSQFGKVLTFFLSNWEKLRSLDYRKDILIS